MAAQFIPRIFLWWHRTPLYIRILAGMFLGVVVGLSLGEKAEILSVPSKLVLQLLGALAPGLILFAIIQALLTAKIEGARLIRLLLLNTLVAIMIGLAVANVVEPGKWASFQDPVTSSDKTDAPHVGMLYQFLENVPKSLLGPLGDDGKVIGVIFLAVAFGVALRRSVEKPIRNVVDAVNLMVEALIVILHWIIDLVPLAVFGIVASIIGVKGFAAFHALGAFVFAVILALILQGCYYLIRIRIWSWVRPWDLLRLSRDALVMAFSTSSSTVTMPLTFECLRKRVGLREKSASMGALVGSNFNNDGTALYEAMAALFISQMLVVQGLGVDLTVTQQLLVVLTSVAASVGAAGIPEAGLVTMTMVFQAVGLPIEYIALLLPVDWFLDRCRTVINVMGDMNVSCMLDGKTRESPQEAQSI